MQLVNSTLSQPITQYTLSTNNAKSKTTVAFNKVEKNNVKQIEIDSDAKQHRVKDQQSANNKQQAELVYNQEAVTKLQNQQLDDVRHHFNDNASQERTSKEQVTFQNKTAVSQYQVVGALAQRESVQQMFGIDLLA